MAESSTNCEHYDPIRDDIKVLLEFTEKHGSEAEVWVCEAVKSLDGGIQKTLNTLPDPFGMSGRLRSLVLVILVEELASRILALSTEPIKNVVMVDWMTAVTETVRNKIGTHLSELLSEKQEKESFQLARHAHVKGADGTDRVVLRYTDVHKRETREDTKEDKKPAG